MLLELSEEVDRLFADGSDDAVSLAIAKRREVLRAGAKNGCRSDRDAYALLREGMRAEGGLPSGTIDDETTGAFAAVEAFLKLKS